ncbi:MAG: ABC transporter ATP-binding protein [Clostridia bacterium]|nr:ABC transporter ATP-binding protein [Clostridia bacterium]
MIEMQNVCKYYRLGDEVVKAMDDVTLSVEKNEYVAIIGPSGSGKSTLMHTIGCLDMADKGRYLLNGLDVTLCTENELATIRAEMIGFVFQQFYLLPQMSAFENVEMPLLYKKVSSRERKKRVIEALKRVGLADRMHHRPDQLSGGQQQRVAIARALVVNPSVILADEPTGNLDSSSGEEIMRLLEELHSQGNTLLIITHSERIAQRADRRIRVHDGHVSEEADL